MKSKWQLAVAPFKGGSLFGEALDPVLVERKDKKKVLPHAYWRTDRWSTFPFRRQSFQASAQGFPNPGYQRSFPQPADRSLDRQPFRDRFHQSQARCPFRGASHQLYHQTKWLHRWRPYWLPSPISHRLAKNNYRRLGLINYFTRPYLGVHF